MKRDTKHWLHGRISLFATKVTGIDSSSQLPVEGISTGPTSHIYKGDGGDPKNHVDRDEIDIIVAGEFIEHLENPLAFLRAMKQQFPGRELYCPPPTESRLPTLYLEP